MLSQFQNKLESILIALFSENLTFSPEIFMFFTDISGHFVLFAECENRCEKKLA